MNNSEKKQASHHPPTPPPLKSQFRKPSSNELVMDSLKGSSGFCYNPMVDAADAEAAEGLSGVLNIFVHQARHIHNICIYDEQDVYAKFSLTCSPEEALSTRIVEGGGRNPRFDQPLALSLALARPDAVLKCEIWMLSRAPAVLEDQLLGFALVPLASLAAAGTKTTRDFTLSSTDLFHSPAGTVQLTLSLDTAGKPPFSVPTSSSSSSIASEVVLIDPAEYGRIEFPDVNVATENQKMVLEYFDMAAKSSPARTISVAPFLRLGASPHSVEDYDMAGDNSAGCASPEGSYQNSGLFSSTVTSLSDDRNSADSPEKNNKSPDVENIDRMNGEKDSELPRKREAEKASSVEQAVGSKRDLGSVFESPLGNIDFEAEHSAMQQQIVDMYMRSMQQFTESLAKMKLPMDLSNPKAGDSGDVIQSQDSKLDTKKNKKDGCRVFYGSRAFF